MMPPANPPPRASNESLAGVEYARQAGLLFGVFLVMWAFLGESRWTGRGHDGLVRAESVLFFIYGALLLLPWRKIGLTPVWKKLFTLVCVLSVIFALAMVCEVMALNYIAHAAGRKIPPPVFQSVQLFAALGQIPTLIFLRRPDRLD